MTEDQEKTRLILLRILGVLLIAVGFTMLAQQVRSETAAPLRFAQSIVFGETQHAPSCDRKTVQIRKIRLTDAPPAPPAVPPLQAVQPPPAPPALTF